MANALMAPGGGKVMVHGLTPTNVVSGQTVTVTQGSKILERVTGTGGSLSLIGYTLQNGAGYSDVTATWIAVAGSIGGSSLVVEEPGTYTVMALMSGNGNPKIYLDGTEIGSYYQDSAVSVQTLSAGAVFTGRINSSGGNGNGSGMVACVVLKGSA